MKDLRIIKIIFLSLIFIGGPIGIKLVQAQATKVVPFAATPMPNIPSGKGGIGKTCDSNINCHFSILIEPYCYGTNARDIPTDRALHTIEVAPTDPKYNEELQKKVISGEFEIQLPSTSVASLFYRTFYDDYLISNVYAQDEVQAEAMAMEVAEAMVVEEFVDADTEELDSVAVTEEKGTNYETKSFIKIDFSPLHVYSAGGNIECAIEAAPREGNARKFKCSLGGKDYIYTTMEWKSKKNQGFGAYGGAGGWAGVEYLKYAGMEIKATTTNIAIDPLNREVNCFYDFVGTSNYTINEDKVNCNFKDKNERLDQHVKVYQKNQGSSDYQELPNTVTSIESYRHMIKVNFYKAVPGIPAVKLSKGHIIPHPDSKRPFISPLYTQRGKSLFSSHERIDLSIPAYKTFHIVTKFPGKAPVISSGSSVVSQLGHCGSFLSPLMLFFNNQRPTFTGKSQFPLMGTVGPTHWPEAGAPGHFLAIDKHKNKIIAHRDQLFGNNFDKKQKDGFAALRLHDKNKDGVINKKDPIFKSLVLWNDKNGNGVSEPNEVFTLKDKGVVEISLKTSKYGRPTYYHRSKTAMGIGESAFKTNKKKKGKVIDIWFKQI